MTLHLRIDRVVLDGLALQRGEAHRFRAAMSRELTRLLRHGLGGEVSAASALAAIAAPPIALASNASPAEIGRAVARSVYRGIGGRR